MSPLPASVPDASAMRLEVLGKIASGGMARVDLARDLDSGQLVALKRLHVHLERDPEFVAMFLDEAWMTAAVDHPNIVRLLGSGRDDEGMFLVMELVDGPSLSGLAAEAHRQDVRLPADLLAYIALQVARGLSAMHELCDEAGSSLGLVHRDLTPSNVLIGLDGSVRITDFGVAKAAGRTSKTSTGVIKGKTRYLSPEYIRSRQVDARSDLYSLGLSLFVVATGRKPFAESVSVQVVEAILTRPAPRIIDFEPTFDPVLSALVDELQRKDPAARPADAREVQRRLLGWIADRGASEAELQRRLARFTARHGEIKRERLAALTRATHVAGESTAPAVADDQAPTRVAYAQRGVPEQQLTRLAGVRSPAPAPEVPRTAAAGGGSAAEPARGPTRVSRPPPGLARGPTRVSRPPPGPPPQVPSPGSSSGADEPGRGPTRVVSRPPPAPAAELPSPGSGAGGREATQATTHVVSRPPPAPAAELPSPGSGAAGGREATQATTRVVSRPPPAPPGAAAVSAAAEDSAGGSISQAVSLPGGPRARDEAPPSSRRPTASIWHTVLASAAVAAVAVVITIVITRSGGGEGEAASASASQPLGGSSAAAPAGGSDGGLEPAASSAPDSAAAPSAAASSTPDGGRPVIVRPPPRRTSSRPRTPVSPPPRPTPKAKPPRPCDPSHFDYPECLYR